MDKALRDQLDLIKTRKDLMLKPNPYLKDTFTGFDGKEYPMHLRYYQIQGLYHLYHTKRFILGDDTGTGKSLQAIGSLCFIWEKRPNQKVIVLTTISASRQWAGEFSKFTTGISTFVCHGTPPKRDKIRKAFLAADGPSVLIMGYRGAVVDFRHLQDLEDYILIADESTAFKNPKTQIHKVCKYLACRAERVWGLTATLIKNNLMEGYGIYEVIRPGLFDTVEGRMNPTKFMLYYAIVRMQRIPKTNRQVPVIVGYTPEKIKEFKEIISPYFYGRAKYEVADELPSLTTQIIEVEMSEQQEEKYSDALAGLLEIGSGDQTVEKETTKLSALIYCQQIVNDLDTLGIDSYESPKLDTLMDILTNGDLAGEKVIVFSRFKKMINLITARLAKEKIKTVRITGDESGDERDVAMKAFQDPSSDVRVVCITMAGSDSINLQAAKALVCVDTPWSAGDFLQLVGRMIRIGSTHDKCFAIHLVAKRPRKNRKTIDDRVMEVLGNKMQLIEAVLGQRFKGVTTTDSTIDVTSDMQDIFKSLVSDAKEKD